MPTFQRICLIHYHEIGLKGHNRSNFEMRLLRNVEQLFGKDDIERIHRISGRLCVTLRPDIEFSQACDLADKIARIPGVARVSCGFICPRSIEAMNEAAVIALSEAGDFTTFKVAARRNHTDFDIDSMQMNQLVGSALCEAFPQKSVKMKDPDVKVCVEVIQADSYVYARSVRGIGGLPVGTGGKVVCLLSSGIDSPVAVWRMARRGAACIGIHFSGRPQTSDTSEYLVDDIAHVLEKSGCIARVYVVPFGDYQRRIAATVDPGLRVIMYRRLMFEVAQEIAQREGARALVTGESLGQVASQTLDNICATDDAVSIPVFRPLIGMDKLEIIDQAQQVGTFDISSQDAPDCCTLFMPRNPETHAQLQAVRQAEDLIPRDTWVKELADSADVHEYRCPGYARKRNQAPRSSAV